MLAFSAAAFGPWAAESRSRSICTQPPTRGMQNGSSVGIYAQCLHVFARLAPSCMLSPCLLKKLCIGDFVSFLRVRCWLGCTVSTYNYRTPSLPPPRVFVGSEGGAGNPISSIWLCVCVCVSCVGGVVKEGGGGNSITDPWNNFLGGRYKKDLVAFH